MKFFLGFTLNLLIMLSVSAQKPEEGKIPTSDTLPYYEIGEYPDTFTAETVVARLIDGLGFRFYWATEGLRPEDLQYKPSPDARTAEETIAHIFDLSEMISKPIKGEQIIATEDDTFKLNFEEMRKKILFNLKDASDLLLSGKVKVSDSDIEFNNKGKVRRYPFWHALNGQIEDAVWHTGQIVSFRRASGNPFNGKANVFLGKVNK